MQIKETRISPAGFAHLRETLLALELKGYDPDLCARGALTSVGLHADEPTEFRFTVDYSLDGPIYPFMDWPRGWIPSDRSTWK